MDEMSKNMSFEYGDDPKFREQETGHVYFETGVDESTEPFAKNVKLEAHTEYTSHVNGKIGESGGMNGLNALIILTEGTYPDLSTDMDFNVAKKAFLSNAPVLFSITSPQDPTYIGYVPVEEFIENFGGTGKDALASEGQTVMFFSDGSVHVI